MIISPMILTILGPFISNLINYLWYEYFGLLDRSFKPKRLYYTKQDSALDYYEVNYGAEIPIFTKYPFIMNIVFMSMMYGLAMPIITYLTLLALLMSYIIEKIAIFWHVKKPPLFDDALSNNTVYFLKWAAVLYPAMGFWQVTNRQMFDNVVHPKHF